MWLAKGHQQLAPTTATALTVPSGAQMCLITVASNPVRFRDDGTNPTATVGIVLPKDLAPFQYNGPLTKVVLIDTSAGASKVEVSYYG